MDLEIRPPHDSDLPDLVGLLIMQLREHQNELVETEIADAAEGLLRRPQRGQFLIAIRAGTVVGFAALSYLWTLERGGRAAWLDELYVVPEHRGGGIGTALLEAALVAARTAGALAVDLEIEADHGRAASLYRRAGFAPLPRTRWARALESPSGDRRPSPGGLEGGCFCGAVRYHIGTPPFDVAHCHCSICRRTSGAPFVTWLTVGIGAVTFTAAPPRELRSSLSGRRTFCSSCGTALTFRSMTRPDLIDITVGSLDEPNALTPDAHIWTSSQLAWLHVDDDLPRHPERGADT
jgi:GNAT superfamily N-acetyltransferase